MKQDSGLLSAPKLSKGRVQHKGKWTQDNEFWDAVDDLVLGHLSPF